MKKLIALVLALGCVLSLVSCGKTTGSGDPVAGGADMPTVENDGVIQMEQTQPAQMEIPSMSEVSQMEYSEVNEALTGKDIKDIREAWGEPVESDNKEDVWQLDESMLLFITYNDTGIIENCELICGTPLAPTNENKTISFHDKTFNKLDLSEDTIEWLEKYNSLSEEEQLAMSHIPAELYELCGYPTADDMEATEQIVIE